MYRGEINTFLHTEIPGKKSLICGWEVSVHPVITQEDIRNTELPVSIAASRQMHLQGRDQHPHGVGTHMGKVR